MVPADQFLQCDVRLRQAKSTADTGRPFGGLAMTICCDFLHLPPVDKDGTKQSLAKLAVEGDAEDEGEGAEEDTKEAKAKAKVRREKAVETQQGRHIWENVRRVICLDVNVRAPGLLGRLQEEMRQGCLSDDMWNAYLSRV